MKRNLLLTALLLLYVSGLFAQNIEPYSKKQTKVFVEKLRELVSANHFEQALDLYETEKGLILEKNIGKSNRNEWLAISTCLTEKKTVFQDNESRVRKAWHQLANGEYWDCNEAVASMQLDSMNARTATISLFKDLCARLETVRPRMQEINSMFPLYVEKYNNGSYEELLGIAEMDDFVKYVMPANRNAANALLSRIKEMKVSYESIYEETITKPQQQVRWGTFDCLGFTESKDQMLIIEEIVSSIKSSNYDKGSFPNLASAQSEMLSRLYSAKGEIQKRMAGLDPKKAIMGGDPVSYSQVKSDCVYDFAKLRSILDLDVCSYYGKSFKSDLQKSVFMESQEYLSLLSELKKKKQEALNTVYAHSYSVNTGSYLLENNAFYVQIGTNEGMSIPFINVLKGDYSRAVGGENKVVVESLVVAEFYHTFTKNYYVNGDSYRLYQLKIPFDKAKAVYYENKNCELIICFVPKGVKRYDFSVTEIDGGKMRCYPFEMWRKYPYATSCRVLLFSEGGELLFDKLY